MAKGDRREADGTVFEVAWDGAVPHDLLMVRADWTREPPPPKPGRDYVARPPGWERERVPDPMAPFRGGVALFRHGRAR